MSGKKRKVASCWCGETEAVQFSPGYLVCKGCGGLFVEHMPEINLTRVTDDATDFYGKEYYLSHVQKDYGLPDLDSRSRTDLPERCLHWLRALLRYKGPQAKVLELGSAHGGFVAMLREAGFDATGLELSPWLVDYAKKTFGVPMLCGPVEEQDIKEGSLDVVALMDVLEHLPDPVKTIRRCLELLKPDGILLIQTPCFPDDKGYAEMKGDNDAFLFMLKEEEHLNIFGRRSVTEFFRRLGADYIVFEAAIFWQYDMFFVVGRQPLSSIPAEAAEEALTKTVPGGRILLAMIDLAEANNAIGKHLQEVEADRAARLEAINGLTARLQEVEADRAARLEAINRLVPLEKEKADLIEELQSTSNELESITKKYHDFRSELEKTMTEKAALVLERNQLMAKGKSVVNSLSWRITASLRYIGKFFMK